MKHLIYLILLTGSCIVNAQVTDKKFIDELFMKTSTSILPLYSKLIDDDKIEIIEDTIIVKCLLQNDYSKLQYNYHYYDDDNQKNMVEIAKYHYYRIGKFRVGNFNTLIYCRYGNSNEQYIIATFSSNQMIDNLIFGYSEGGGETEIEKYTEGEILEDYTIKTKSCVMNPDYSEQKRKENPDYPRSVVTLTQYKIDPSTGKINLISVDKKYSKCIPEEFTYKGSNCKLTNSTVEPRL